MPRVCGMDREEGGHGWMDRVSSISYTETEQAPEARAEATRTGIICPVRTRTRSHSSSRGIACHPATLAWHLSRARRPPPPGSTWTAAAQTAGPPAPWAHMPEHMERSSGGVLRAAIGPGSRVSFTRSRRGCEGAPRGAAHQRRARTARPTSWG